MVKAFFEGSFDDQPLKKLDLVAEQTNYAHMTKVIKDTVDSMKFMVVLAEEEPIIIDSAQRDEVITELRIFWRTDFMVRLWRAPRLPVVDEFLRVPRLGAGGDVASYTKPPAGKTKLTYAGYFFFANDKMKEAPNPLNPVEILPGHFQEGQGVKVILSKEKMRAANTLGMRDVGNLRVAVEKEARKFINSLIGNPSYVMLTSDVHRKKMNLSGDLASWTCWLVHLRTSQNDFVVVGCRRKFIPPSGEKYQNVWLKYKGPVITEGDPLESIGYMVDTMGPSVSVSYYDELAIQIRTNLLQNDEDMFTFFFNRLNIEPELEDMHIKFYKGCVGLLEIEGYQGASQDAVFEEVDFVEEIFVDVIDPLKDDPHEGASKEEWAPRLARYLGFCLDGGVLPEDIGLDDMCRLLANQGRTEDMELIECIKTRPMIMRVLDFLVHPIPRGKSWPKDLTKIFQADGELVPSFTEPGNPRADLMKRFDELVDFEFQPRIMIRLIELGFISREMDSVPRYIKFLYRLLRMRAGQDVRCAICIDIARLSQNPKDREALANEGVIELMLKLLNSKDELIVSHCGRALVNLSAETKANKDRMCAGNQGSKNLRLMLKCLGQPSDELRMVFSKLVKNLASDEAYNKLFGNSGACKIVGSILMPPAGVIMPPGPIQKLDELRVAVCAAAWKLAEFPANRDKLLIEKAHKSVIDILKETENEDVIEKAAGALMVLATGPDETIKEDCQTADAVPTLVHNLEVSRGKLAVRNVVAALLVLTSDKANMEAMMALKDTINDLLTDREGLIKTEKQLESFVDHLQTRLASE